MVSLITTVLNPPILGTDTDAVFSDKVDTMFGTDLPAMANEMNALGLSLADDVAGADYSTSSVTSNNLTTGAKSFTVAAGKMFVPGQDVVIVSAATPAVDRMWAVINTYNFSTGAMTATVYYVEVGASGSAKTDWFIAAVGARGPAGTASPWAQIGSTINSPGVGPWDFTSIPTTYNDLLLIFEFDTTASGNRMAVSFGAGSYGGSPAPFHDTSFDSPSGKGSILIPGYKFDYGQWLSGSIAATSPNQSGGASSVAAAANAGAGGWIVTGGITSIRITAAANTTTAILKIYGR